MRVMRQYDKDSNSQLNPVHVDAQRLLDLHMRSETEVRSKKKNTRVLGKVIRSPRDPSRARTRSLRGLKSVLSKWRSLGSTRSS